jgi:hypothetical protein
MGTEVATTTYPALIQNFAKRIGVSPALFTQTIKATVLKTKDRPATNEELVAFLAIADKYGLDPWTKQIHAFVGKDGGIVPIVGVDGWNHLERTNADFAGEAVEVPPPPALDFIPLADAARRLATRPETIKEWRRRGLLSAEDVWTLPGRRWVMRIAAVERLTHSGGEGVA